MKLVTPQEMAEIDRRAMEEYGIPGIVLMENAGLRVVEVVRRLLGGEVAGRRVDIFSGRGNNGGDGLVVARHLMNAGARVNVFLLAPPDRIAGDARTNLSIYERQGGRVYPVLESRDIMKAEVSLLRAEVVVDAIFGTGFKGAASGTVAEVIKLINDSRSPVVAVDIPSGLEADSGRVEGECIRAHTTVTFGLPKLGLFLEPGASYAGEVIVADISLPSKLIAELPWKRCLLTEDFCKGKLAARPADSHKGDYGHVLVVGGSRGMTGALFMACEAALRSGAGLVTAGVGSSLNPIMEAKTTEVMTLPLPETEEGSPSRESWGILDGLLSRFNVLALGPGMGRHMSTQSLVAEVIERTGIPVVVDADGINALAGRTTILARNPGRVVLTPHPGEMARLTGRTVAEVQSDRLSVAEEYAREWQAFVVLKGWRTIVACPDGRTYVNTTGNPGMSTGGSGDVLTGLIAGFIAQGLEIGEACALGVYLHGAAGDEAAKWKSERCLVAGDLLTYLPEVLRRLEQKRQ